MGTLVKLAGNKEEYFYEFKMEHEHTHHMEAQETSATFTNEVLENDQGSEDHVHNQHGLHDGMDMMKMYFHGGYTEVILFDFWRISTLGGLIGSMIGCFILGLLYEGLKFLREFLIGRGPSRSRSSRPAFCPAAISFRHCCSLFRSC